LFNEKKSSKAEVQAVLATLWRKAGDDGRLEAARAPLEKPAPKARGATLINLETEASVGCNNFYFL